MLAKLRTFSLLGIEAVPVDVEVDVSPATMPKTILVGLPEAAVKESTHRVERAMVNSGFQRPYDRVVINLAPAELPKQAASFDLPITLGVLAGSGQLASERFDQYAVVGELSLEGRTRPAKGALSMALSAAREGPARDRCAGYQCDQSRGGRGVGGDPGLVPGRGRSVLRGTHRDRSGAVAAAGAIQHALALRRRLLRPSIPQFVPRLGHGQSVGQQLPQLETVGGTCRSHGICGPTGNHANRDVGIHLRELHLSENWC